MQSTILPTMPDVGVETDSTSGALGSRAILAMIEDGKLVRSVYRHGWPTEQFEDELAKLVNGSRAILIEADPNRVRTIYVWEGAGLLEVRRDGDGEIILTGTTHDQTLVDRLNRLAEFLETKTPKGTFRILVRTPGGFELRDVGRVDAPIERENYPSSVLTDFDHVAACLASRTPCGRLILLEGEPGTGKSFLIRALASQVDATFVLVASSLVGQLSGPDVIPVLLGNSEQRGPMVLVMEDADQAIVKREGANRSALSEILNLGDGLLGDLLDLRVLATTNAEAIKLDDAITRAGRMCRHLRVREVSIEHARAIHERLTGKEMQIAWNQTPRTLAGVYRLARQDGWAPEGKAGAAPGQYV